MSRQPLHTNEQPPLRLKGPKELFPIAKEIKDCPTFFLIHITLSKL